MKRVECVIAILQQPAVITLFAAIQPNGDQRQKGETLTNEKVGFAKQLQFVSKSAQHLHVDVPQAEQLTGITPPFLLPEEIEYKDSQNARVVEIHHGQQSCDITDHNGRTSHQQADPKLFLGFGLFIPMDQDDDVLYGQQLLSPLSKGS